MSKLKKKDKAEREENSPCSATATVGASGQKTSSFKAYDLTGLPEQALPVADQAYKGLHSYTVWVQGAVPQPKNVKIGTRFMYIHGPLYHYILLWTPIQ